MMTMVRIWESPKIKILKMNHSKKKMKGGGLEGAVARTKRMQKRHKWEETTCLLTKKSSLVAQPKK